MGVNPNHFKEVHTNGHLAIIIPVEEYLTIIGKNVCIYDPPVNINAYNPTAANATAVVRVVKEAEWKRKLTALKNFNGSCAGLKDLIIYGVGE